MSSRTLWLVSLALISILVLSNLQIYAWEGEGSGEIIVRGDEETEDFYNVKLEIVSPRGGTEIYFKRGGAI
ncbi:unnamed protein product, partial [marine sediment metagenome]